MCGWISFNGLHVTSKYIIVAYSLLCTSVMGRDSSVGIATRYGLDGPGIESRWG